MVLGALLRYNQNWLHRPLGSLYYSGDNIDDIVDQATYEEEVYLLLCARIGVPRDFFTAFFAASRVSGWVVHTLEQYADAVFIRPTSEYVG